MEIDETRQQDVNSWPWQECQVDAIAQGGKGGKAMKGFAGDYWKEVLPECPPEGILEGSEGAV